MDKIELCDIVSHLARECGEFLKVYEQHPIFRASSYQAPDEGDRRGPMRRALALSLLYDAVYERFVSVTNDEELTGRHGVHEDHEMLTKLAFFRELRVEADKFGGGRERACTFDAMHSLLQCLESTCLASVEGLLTVGEQATLKAMKTTYPHKRASLVGVIERAAALRYHEPSPKGWESEPAGDGSGMSRLWGELKGALSSVHATEMDKFISSVSALSNHAHEDERVSDGLACNKEYLKCYYDCLVFIGVGKDLDGEWYEAGAEESPLHTGHLDACDAGADGCKTMDELVDASHPLQRCMLFSKCAFYFSKLIEKLHKEDSSAWRVAKMFADGKLCDGFPDFLKMADLPPTRKELSGLLLQKWSTWPLSTVLGVCGMCDAEHGARFLFEIAAGVIETTVPNNPPNVGEEWFGKIALFDLYVKLTMAPPMVLQSCMLNHFLAKDYGELMDDESSLKWRRSMSAHAIREICNRTDPVALARRVSEYLDAAHDGPKIQHLLHPLVRHEAIAGTTGLASWSPADIANMLSMIRGWTGVEGLEDGGRFPDTVVTKAMSKRELVVALLDSWFHDGMLVKDAHHRAKARLLKSGKSEFMSSMVDVYKEMSTRKIERGHHLVAFLPDVLYKTKPFVRFVRNVQRHCTGRRPLFSVRTEEFAIERGSNPGTKGTPTLGGVADKLTFETISRQYHVRPRFAVEECVHPEIDGWDQDELEVDHQYTPLSGAEWHVSAPAVVFNVDETSHVGYDGEWVGKPSTSSDAASKEAYGESNRKRTIESTCAVVWRDVDGVKLEGMPTPVKREIIGYFANDDTRDFFDVMSCAMETWGSNGKMVQPCCLIVDNEVCAPRHRLEMIATSGVDECADDEV